MTVCCATLLMIFSDVCRDANFCSHLLELVVPILVNQQTSTNLFHSLTTGLELLVVNFSLTAQERAKIATTAASRYVCFMYSTM